MSINRITITNEPKMSIAMAADFLGVSMQAVHKQLKSKNLTCPKLGNKSYINYKIAKDLFGIKFEKKVIVGQIVKGGTGKTTTIDNIASCANTYGAKVLKIDTDPQGNLTDANGVDAENVPVLIDVIKNQAEIKESIVNIYDGIDLIPSRIENVILDNIIFNERLPLHTMYQDLLAPIINNYDFVFIDCPPTMGHSVAAASLFADTILVPLNPDKFSAKGLRILKHEVETLSKKYRKQLDYKVYLNKFSSKTILSDKAIVSLISDPDLDGKVLSTTVQYAQEVPNIADQDKNIFSHMKKSAVRDDFDQLTRELLNITPRHIRQDAKNNLDKISLEVQ